MRIIKEKSLFTRVKDFIKSGYLGSSLVLFILSLALPVTILLVFQRQDIRQKAASQKTATMNFSPSSGNFPIGQRFTVALVLDGGGQTFNAAQARMNVSSNLAIRSLTIVPPENGGCNFTFVSASKTPSVTDPSFAGGILNNFSSLCTLYTLDFEGTATGPGSITMTQSSIKGYENSGEILLSSQDGNYNIELLLTPTPTTAPTNTPTPTMFIPTPTNTPIPLPSPTPTISPTPILVAPPIFDPVPPSDTYLAGLNITGSKSLEVTEVWVNGTNTEVTYPTSTTWQYSAVLQIGPNIISLYGKDSQGNSSVINTATISRHRTADINGDNIIDLTDLSIFGSDWEKTANLTNSLSDINSDGLVDLTDFSMLAKAYGN